MQIGRDVQDRLVGLSGLRSDVSLRDQHAVRLELAQRLALLLGGGIERVGGFGQYWADVSQIQYHQDAAPGDDQFHRP